MPLVREFANQVLLQPDLERKLARPTGDFSDDGLGEPNLPACPSRPEHLKFAARRTAPAMPPPGRFHEPHQRAIAHHIMANHELQALEVMALVALKFPEAPREFRLGLVAIMQDEQRHTQMHVERAAALGVTFGQYPVNSYIWNKSLEFDSVLEYLAGLPLTFEGRNLDHTLEFADLFDRVSDPKSAAVMRAIHRDEIQHVAFGLHWLRRLKPADSSDWDTYVRSLKWPLRPEKSIGDEFHIEPRRLAGMDEEFISRLKLLQIDLPQE